MTQLPDRCQRLLDCQRGVIATWQADRADLSTRRMENLVRTGRWQRLHRLIYFAALAGVIHYYWLVKSDVRLPLIYGAILAVLVLYRLATRKPTPQRASHRPTTTSSTASLPD